MACCLPQKITASLERLLEEKGVYPATHQYIRRLTSDALYTIITL